MKRVSLGWVLRQGGVLGVAVFIGVGLYGVFQFLFGSPPQLQVTFQPSNATSFFFEQGKIRGEIELQIGEIVPNCGLDNVCPDHHFPVHIYSGKTKDDRPRVCVSGRYIVEKNINNGGRGLNFVVVDPNHMRAVGVRRFDTYAVESKEVGTFLSQELLEGDILVVVTFDEASRNLSPAAKTALTNLGSSQIQNLQFRGQWFMVTQRGMEGFSPYEDLKPSKAGLWSPIDQRLCVPKKLYGRSIMPDPSVNRNTERTKFCQQHPQITDFCSVDNHNAPLRPAILTSHQYVGSPMFTTPIMVVAGSAGVSSLSDLTLTLQTLLGQPGIQSKYVVVVYDPKSISDVPALCRLFSFTSKPVVPRKFNATLQYYELMEAAFETALTSFPSSPLVTVIESGLLLSPDFLAYTASLLPVLHDPTIIGISAWNPNGYYHVSTRPDLAYRTEDFPGLAFTLRMETYVKELKPNMKECCNKRGWEGWLDVGRWEREVIVPDVSRVLRRPFGPELNMSLPPVQAFFQRLRATNLDIDKPIHNPERLVAQGYESHLTALLNASTTRVLKPTKEQVIMCAKEQDIQHLNLDLPNNRSEVIVLPYKEDDLAGFKGMNVLCQCFGLFYVKNTMPRGLHRGLIRFSMKTTEIFLLSNQSPHYHIAKFDSANLILP